MDNNSYIDDGEVIVDPIPLVEDNIEEIISSLAKEEVIRIRRNLQNLDSLENLLIVNVQEQLRDVGRVDNKTLMEVIKTFNRSVTRSNDIIKGNASNNLVQILIDARQQTDSPENPQRRLSNPELDEMNLKSRKRVRNILAALIEEDETIGTDQDEGENL